MGKESACNAGVPGLIPGLGRSPWRRDRLPTPVFMDLHGGSDGKSHGWRSLVGYSPCGHKELDMTEGLHFLSFSFLPTVERAYILQSAKPSIQSWL